MTVEGWPALVMVRSLWMESNHHSQLGRYPESDWDGMIDAALDFAERHFAEGGTKVARYR